MDVVNGMFVGAVVGLLIAIPATITVLFSPGLPLPVLVDVHACWGRRCSSLETFLLSLFTHLLVSVAFGGGYMFFSILGVGIHDFALSTILLYALLFFFFLGSGVFPLVGLDFFARHEGRYAWLELLCSHLLLAFGFWIAFRLFPVFLP